MAPENRFKYTLWLLAGILLITFLVYLPSLNNGFTNWDDPEQIIQNTDVHTLSLSATADIFSSVYVGMYQPFTSQVYAIIYSIFGPDATAFHAFSLLVHLLNTVLVFLVVRAFIRRDTPALITAALFALNPLQTESVAWVSATSNLLYTFFYLAGLIIYIRYVRKKQLNQLFFAFLLFALSLLSKPAAVTFPVIILLIDLYYRRKVNWRLMIEKLPFFILSVIIGLVIIYAREEAGHIINISERFNLGERILMVFYALAFYITRLFVPLGLSAFHPYPQEGLPVEFYIAPLVSVMFVYLVFRLRGEQKRQVMAGLLFFLLTIGVVLEFIPIGVQLVKERYVYMPSIGIYFAFAVLMLFLFERKYRWLPPAITMVLIALFSMMTFLRTSVWNDSFSLWNDVLAQYPNASAALINRGNAWQQEGDYSQAIADYSIAIKSEPGAADAYLNRGLAYYQLENKSQALNNLDQAIELGARDAGAYNSRGLIRVSLGRIDEARSDFVSATEIDPGHTDAWINLGLLEANKADYRAAMQSFSMAVKADPGSAKAYYWRGRLLLQMGLTNEACNDLQQARANGWPADMIPEICR